MKLLLINVVCGVRSTGKICMDIADTMDQQGHSVKIAYGREKIPSRCEKYAVRIGSDFGVKLHWLEAKIFDSAGFGSTFATKKLIRFIKEYDPDIIHLHNIHGYYLNIEVLFKYLSSCGKQIVWSLYDCWSFTGHCAHFDFNGCTQWMTGCKKCDYLSEYPKSYFLSRSALNYQKKRKVFCGVPRLHLIAPSQWMANMLSKSYLSEYSYSVIPNGIDNDVFVRTDGEFRAKYNLTDSFIALGVSVFWNKEKGLDYFIKIASSLQTENIKFVLVGEINLQYELPDNILHINRTDSVEELCEIYSSANIFVNPTLQETQGLTTVEALSCGVPAIVFDSGGAPECITDDCGIIVKRGDVQGLIGSIKSVYMNPKRFSPEKCREQALKYNKKRYSDQILELYQSILSLRE